MNSLHLISVRWWNGSAHHALTLARALRQSGLGVLVAGRRGSPPILEAARCHLPVYDGLHHESIQPWRLVLNLYRLKTLVQTRDVGLIHVHRAEDQFHALLAKQIFGLGIPIVRTVSDDRPVRQNPLNRRFYTRGLSFCLFTCRAVRRRYLELWPELNDRSAVLPGAIDTEHFTRMPRNLSLRQRLGVKPHHVLVGMVARLSPVKDHTTFLQAARLLASRNPDVRFVVSGEAVEITHQQLRAQIGDLELAERVICLDRQPDVRPLLAALDVGVVASRGSEVTCRIAMEMMAMGLPVVATRVNALADLIEDEVSGLLVPPQTPPAMASALARLITDPALRRNLGRNARLRAEQTFSPAVFARKVHQIYLHVLKSDELKKNDPVHHAHRA